MGTVFHNALIFLPEILLGSASHCRAVRLRLRYAQDDTGWGICASLALEPVGRCIASGSARERRYVALQLDIDT